PGLGSMSWRDRPASATFERRAAPTVLVREVIDDYDGTYGHRRVHAQLGREGVDAGVELVRSIMPPRGSLRASRARTVPRPPPRRRGGHGGSGGA
ncbi:MAG TPA: IS3 family transposase, partial [Euzebyales bacterium]|nr:IS3 family transposase [Euzebyales bacterium]